MRSVLRIWGLLFVLFVYAREGAAQSLLDSTQSLSSIFLAGKRFGPNFPDGSGVDADVTGGPGFTGCRGKLYFLSNHKLRVADPGTGTVRTLADWPNGRDLWCDRTDIYSSTTAAGPLVIEQMNLATLQLSRFSYPLIGSYAMGTSDEHVSGIGRTLYSTDSASGRIWKIDLETRERSPVVDFGGPHIRQYTTIPSVLPVGPFQTDGTDIYVLQLLDSPVPILAYLDLVRVHIATGERTTLLPGTHYWMLWLEGSSLYLSGSTEYIQRLDLIGGRTSPFIYATPGSLWGDGTNLYLMGTVLQKANLSTGELSAIAGDFRRSADGTGSEVRFSIDDAPFFMELYGDSKAVYIADGALLRRYDTSANVVSTIADTASYGRSIRNVWSDGIYAYLTVHTSILRIDLATREINTVASGLSRPFQLSGDGSNLYFVDESFVIRKLVLATGNITTIVPAGGLYNGLWAGAGSLSFNDDHRVRRLNLVTLETETIAGGLSEGTADGIGGDARFTSAVGLWGNGTSLFVVDANRKIRRINLATRRVTTLYSSAEPISQGIFGDAGHLYLMEGLALHRFEPEAPPLTFVAPAQGLSVIDLKPASSLTVLHAEIASVSGNGAAAGTAIWSYRNNEGVTVSEAAVPAQAAIRSGRIYAEVDGPANTGIAISNPNNQDVRIDFFFTGVDGQNFGQGFTTIPSHGQLARFLDEAPFSGGGVLRGSFTFTSSLPISTIAIRGFTNERSEFLMTTLPVVDLDAPVPYDPLTMAHFASGGGWKTKVLLVNPTETALSGTIDFIDDAGHSVSSDGYTVAPRAAGSFQAGSDSPDIRKGSVRVTSQGDTPVPTPLVVFAYAPTGITVTESGVAAMEGTDFASYVEATGADGTTGGDVLNSGIAIANTTDQSETIDIKLATANGSLLQTTTVVLAPHAQTAKFLTELFPSLQLPFTGVVNISERNGRNLSVTGLRGRYNARGEFIVSTVAPVVRASPAAGPKYMPHLISGGGYSTKLFLINPSPRAETESIRLHVSDGISIEADCLPEGRCPQR